MKIRNAVTMTAAAIAVATISACTTMGTGTGTVASSDAPVSFAWREKDPTHGTISATLADGRQFDGTYTQVPRPEYLVRADSKDYQDYVTSRVHADLQASDGERMACTFRLANTVGGMGEGAKGECVLGDTTIDAVLPRSLPPGI